MLDKNQNSSNSKGSIAPSFSVLSLSGTTKSTSTVNFWPKPSHVGQAPKGLLKLTLWLQFPIENPHIGQAWLSENLRSSPSMTSTVNCPSESSKAVSIESASRVSFIFNN